MATLQKTLPKNLITWRFTDSEVFKFTLIVLFASTFLESSEETSIPICEILVAYQKWCKELNPQWEFLESPKPFGKKLKKVLMESGINTIGIRENGVRKIKGVKINVD